VNDAKPAKRSANKMEVHLNIAKQLGYSSVARLDACKAEYAIVGRQLNRLIAVWRTIQPPDSSLQPSDPKEARKKT
jgi:hypothetical protein